MAEMCSIHKLCVLYGHRYWMCIEVYYYGSWCIHGDRAIAPLISISTLLHINYAGIVLLHERTVYHSYAIIIVEIICWIVFDQIHLSLYN